MPKGVYARPSLTERLWRNVQRDDVTGCIEWQGAISTNGYGQLFSRINGELKSFRAHRIAWLDTHGPVPDGLILRHRCDNPICVNPEHLQLGTSRDNARDREERDRNPSRWITHCPSGHPYDITNTYLTPRGHRKCRACNRLRATALRESRQTGGSKRK